jgi:two-component system, NarL family, nitrate/nitrite response regulator NarL
MKIVLVDDHFILIEGISALLENTYSVEGIFSDPQKALAFINHHETDLLITDYEMPRMNGIELFIEAKKSKPLLKGVLLSMHDEASVVKRAIKSGLNGFLLKNVSRLELNSALEKIAQGHKYISAELTQKLVQEVAEPEKFSEREKQVLQLIIKEFTNKQIADTLSLSERTVETYRKNLFRKAQTNNVVGLVKYAFLNKLVE